MRIFLFLFLFSWCVIGQQTDYVDFERIQANISVDRDMRAINGSLTASFHMLKDADSIYLDAINMKLTEVLPQQELQLRSTKDKIWITGDLKADNRYSVTFDYEAVPRQTLYFTGDQIWTQGQGKYTSHWLPSLDDMNDKLEFDFTITADSDQRVLANGALQKLTPNMEEGTISWHFDMKQPMSSYLAAMSIGPYKKKIITSASGVEMELHLKEQDTAYFEPTYRYTKEIFDFLEEEIGVPYPWANYKQVPVRDFLYAGMENTTLTIFSEAFVVDSIGFNDRNYVNVNAHELAHQWFGNLVTETSGTHHWLQEGFATYYALLAEREIFGDDYYYWKLYNTAETLQAMSLEGKGESLLNPKASSLTFYEKGAWALHILRELIGDESFKQAVRSYLERFKFKNVSTEDFLEEVRKTTLTDISSWEKDWLKQAAFKAEAAYLSLRKSAFIEQYFELQRLRATDISEKKKYFSETQEIFSNDFLGQEVIYQLSGEPLSETFQVYIAGFESGNLFARQAIALSLNSVPESLRTAYETLLNDSSYITREAALYALWSSFPEHRKRYLDTTKDMVGFQNKNIRMLWLALALSTPDYMQTAKPIFKKELAGYTSSEYSFEIRKNAFEYIRSLGMYDEIVVDNLVDATVHHQWRFRNFARDLLNEVAKNPGTLEAISDRLDSYSEKAQAYLKRELIK